MDEELKKLQIIAAQPELYPEFVNLKATESLLSLFSHENTGLLKTIIITIINKPNKIKKT